MEQRWGRHIIRKQQLIIGVNAAHVVVVVAVVLLIIWMCLHNFPNILCNK